MRRAARCLGSVLALSLVAAGCLGKGAIFLTIEGTTAVGPMQVPDDVDRLVVRVSNEGADAPLFEKEYPLVAQEHHFPLTLALEPGAKTAATVVVEVTAFKGEAQVAQSASPCPIPPEETASVTVRLYR